MEYIHVHIYVKSHIMAYNANKTYANNNLKRKYTLYNI